MFHETLQPIQICTVINNLLEVITFFENRSKKVLELWKIMFKFQKGKKIENH